MTENGLEKRRERREYLALKNSSITLVCQIIYLLLSFVCRTIFTYLLGAEYLGVNGLFANVLTILSFAELGIGTALVYRLYEPISSGNIGRIAALLKLYKKIYTAIILLISVVGLAITPFIHLIVGPSNVSEDIRLLFVLFLAQTVVSYVYVYKKTLLIADQKSYVVNLYTLAFSIFQNLLQIAILLAWRSFVLYLVIGILCNLLNNIACSLRADRDFHSLKGCKEEELDADDIKGLRKDAKGLLYTKIATTAYAGTDNVFISIFIGIRYVGILSNYTLFLSIINGIMNRIFDSVTASIGNMISTGDERELPGVIRKIFFVNAFLYGFVGLEMLFLLKTFIAGIWLTEEYLLPTSVVLIVVIEMILRSMHYPIYITRNALGAFTQYRKVMIGLAFLNLILDYLWVKPFGIFGLYMSTVLCRGITYFFDVLAVYRVKMKTSISSYYLYVLKWGVFLGVTAGVMHIFRCFVSLEGLSGFVAYAVIFMMIYGIMFVLWFSRDEEFQYYLGLFKRIKQR